MPNFVVQDDVVHGNDDDNDGESDAVGILNNKISIIMSQTNYGKETARNLLAANDGDENAVIRQYLGLAPIMTNATTPKSKNQLIYQEIRKFMDGCKIIKPAIN